MKKCSPASHASLPNLNQTAGFTIVELVVVMVITSIMGLAIVINYQTQTGTYQLQRELAHMQQNMRAAMYMIQNDIRNTGRDPERTGRFGIQSIVRANPDADDPIGYGGLTMTRLVDTDNDGDADAGTVQTIAYQVLDPDGDGRRELQRCLDGACQRIVDGIEDIGFAYAYDDGNGDLTRVGGLANAPEIWAIDSNNNNQLDANPDSDGDGDIEIGEVAPSALAANVALNRIRAVRIWLLARSRQAYNDYTDNHTYALGIKVLDMTAAANANRRNFRHLLFTSAVALQNYELDTNL